MLEREIACCHRGTNDGKVAQLAGAAEFLLGGAHRGVRVTREARCRRTRAIGCPDQATVPLGQRIGSEETDLVADALDRHHVRMQVRVVVVLCRPGEQRIDRCLQQFEGFRARSHAHHRSEHMFDLQRSPGEIPRAVRPRRLHRTVGVSHEPARGVRSANSQQT